MPAAGSTRTVALVHDAPANSDLSPETQRLRRENEQLAAEKRILELKVQKLQRMLWDKKSERMPKDDDKQGVFFEEAPERRAEVAPAAGPALGKSKGVARTPKGPQPLDPTLPREVIQVPAPELKELICPVTKRPMQPGFVERIKVLARRAPVYFVKAYERTVFVSPAKTAPVYAAWPAGWSLPPRSRRSSAATTSPCGR